MDYDKYIDLIEQEKYEEATLYKSSFIPDVLYKYFWLDDDMIKNEQRLTTLANGQIYLAQLEQFNDPFEGQAFIFEKEELVKKGWKSGIFEEFVRQINENARICCFANPDEKQQNMPMWAYYANNHRGFCVEYRVSEQQKKFMFPVSYDEKRVNGNALIGNLLNGIIDMLRDGKDSTQMPGEVSAYNHLAYLSLTCKHISWSHEKEIRALVPIKYGKFFSATPNKIFIGMNCIYENEMKLIAIAKKFQGCEIYKMQGLADNSNFYLKEERLKS